MTAWRWLLASSVLCTIVGSEKWVGSVLNDVLHELNSEYSEGNCAEDLEYYKHELEQSKIWAVKMKESSAESVNGIISGNIYELGHFDQCLSVKVPERNFNGKYCLITFRYRPNITLYPDFYVNTSVFHEPSNHESVWKALQVTQDMRFQRRDIIYIGLCVPSSCSAEEVQDLLVKQSEDKFRRENIEIEFHGSENFCTVDKDTYQKKQHGFYIYVSIFIILLIVVIIGSTIQIYNESKGDDKGRWYYVFSIIFNTQKLFNDSSKEFRPASGLKVLSLVIIIYGHRYLLSVYAPVINLNENEQKYGKFWETYILNGSMVVNTFFCTTGYITFYKILKAIENKKSFSYFGAFVYRWIRITTVYALTIFFMVTTLKHVGNGPLWKNAVYERLQACEQTWWANLLYINNYVLADKLCLIPAWYMACDMQLFIFTLVMGYIFQKNLKFGKALLILLLVILVFFVPGLTTFYGNFSGAVVFYIRNINEFHLNSNYLNTYVTTHFRMSPYIIGMFAALLHNYFQIKALKIPFWLHVILAFSTILLTGICLLGAWQFYFPGNVTDPLQSSLYAIYSKLLWSINMCWIIFSNVSGGEELLSSRILSSKVFVVLNKLNLLVLMVHTPLQFILIMSIRTPLYVTHFTIIWMALGDILLSYITAFFIYLLVEAPLSGLIKKLLL